MGPFAAVALMFEITSPASVPVVEGEISSTGVLRLGLPALPSAIPVSVAPLVDPPPKGRFGGPDVHGDIHVTI